MIAISAPVVGIPLPHPETPSDIRVLGTEPNGPVCSALSEHTSREELGRIVNIEEHLDSTAWELVDQIGQS